ncbi:MAG TPA: hypothetical protein VGP07_04535 [Polyangia bacterium]|jgi:hypothetical protein
MIMALPRRSRLPLVLAIGLGSWAGCGGGGKAKQSYPDAASFGSGGATGANGGATGDPGGATGTGLGTGGTSAGNGGAGAGLTDGGVTDTGTGTPDASPPAATNTRLIPGTAILMSPGLTCSDPHPATGAATPDRWCGVFQVGAAANTISLSVFDVTKALAGTATTCTTGDANCISLSPSIDITNTDASYGFFGQTLIYYDATAVYAWRPGWTAGRMLLAHSATQSVGCEASPNDVPTAICLAQTTGNVYAGTIDTQTGGTLPLVEALGSGSTGVSFSPDSLSILYSVNTSTTSPAETLKMQTIGDNTSRKTIATNVTGWTVSTDGKRWFWESAPTTDTTTMLTTGTLQTAPYPAGTTPQGLQAKVFNYFVYGAKGLVSMVNPTASGTDLTSITDVDNPTTTTTMLEAGDVIVTPDVGSDGTVLYATTFVRPDTSSNNVLVDLRAIKADGTGKCVVAATAVADPGATLGNAGTGVEWIQVTLDTTGAATAIVGEVTPLAACTAHVFSSNLYSFGDVSTGLIIQQNYDSTAFTADLVYSLFSGTGTTNASMAIQMGADTVVAPLFPDVPKVLFSLNGGAATDGIYVSGALTGVTTTPDYAPVALPTRLATARFMSTGLSVVSSAVSSVVSSAVSFSPKLGRAPLARPTSLFSPYARGARVRSALPRLSRALRTTTVSLGGR